MSPALDTATIHTMSTTSDRYNVPVCADDGSNWIVYKDRVEAVAGAMGLVRHLRGSARRPPDAPPYPRPAKPASATTASTTLTPTPKAGHG